MTVIAALLEQRTGQQIAGNRVWRLEASLKPLLRDLGMTGMDELATALATSRDDVLGDRVVDTLLNQETSFFRDSAVFDLIAIAAAGLHDAAPARRLRLWSAGCSNGQEPLSLAMLLNERGMATDALDIVATDVSAGAIARARAARYSQFEIQRGLSIHRMLRWFDSDGGDWTAKPELTRQIQYRRHNLASDPLLPGGFDVILCRNILLYFSPDLRRGVFARLAAALRPGGIVVLGAGETVIGQTDHLQPSTRWRGLYELSAQGC